MPIVFQLIKALKKHRWFFKRKKKTLFCTKKSILLLSNLFKIVYSQKIILSSQIHQIPHCVVLWIKLKFDKYIVDYRSSHYINFGVSRRLSFLQDTQSVIHYGPYAQNIYGRFIIVKLLTILMDSTSFIM